MAVQDHCLTLETRTCDAFLLWVYRSRFLQFGEKITNASLIPRFLLESDTQTRLSAFLPVAGIWPFWSHSNPLLVSHAGPGHNMLMFGHLVRTLNRHEKDKGHSPLSGHRVESALYKPVTKSINAKLLI